MRRHTVLPVFCLCVAFGASPVVHALDWPVKNRILTATFGEDRWNHFHDGIDIGGGNQPIHPSAAGQVVFSYEEGEDPRDIPTGLGSFMLIQNSQEFRTLYAHMQQGSLLRDKTTVTTSDVIGIMGDTGDSLGRHLHFEVIDRAKNEIINPLAVLPPLADAQRPVMGNVSLSRGGKVISLSSQMTIPGGTAELIVNVYDPSQYVGYFDPMAPYEIQVTLNGKELFHITYDALGVKDGKSYLFHSDGRTFDNYYVGTWDVRLGSFDLKPGEALLVVTASDIVGNETARSFHLTVRGTSNR